MIKKREKNNAAIYCRLSVDDGLDKESQSIENQKEILCISANVGHPSRQL